MATGASRRVPALRPNRSGLLVRKVLQTLTFSPEMGEFLFRFRGNKLPRSRTQRGRGGRANDPGGIMRRRLIGVIAGEIDRVGLFGKRRDQDRPDRDQRLILSLDLAQVIVTVAVPHQIPAATLQLAIADIDGLASRGNR